MAKKTKTRSTTKPIPRTRPAKKRTPGPTERPKTRRPPKKRTRSPDEPLATNPVDLERPVPEEPVRIQPPPEFVRGRHDPTLEENAAPPHIDESVRQPAMDEPRNRDAPERRRAVARAALDANRWVRQRPNQPRGNAWQARGHSSMRGR